MLLLSCNNSSILADREASENWLYAGKHRFGIWPEEEQADALRAVPRAAVAVVTSCCADRCDYCSQVEGGIDLVG